MIAYIVRRTLLAAFTLLVISFVSFMIVQLPEGDLIDQVAHMLTDFNNKPPDQEQLAELREKLGLNNPLVVQWWDWIFKIVTKGDFGMSYTEIVGWDIRGTPVRNAINRFLPYTIFLSVFTAVITWTFAIPIGIYAAVRQNSIGDYVFTFLGFTGLAVPDFLLGLVAMYVAFAYFDHSVGGIFSYAYLDAPWSVARVMDMLQHLIIPGIVLGTSGTAGLVRIMRNNLLDELGKPYVVTARAKGVSNWKVTIKYPVRVALNPFISGLGSMLPGLIGGSVIVSIVLGLPTLGPTLLLGTLQQDGPLVAAGILLLSSLSVVGTLISDLMLVVVDPRIRLTGSARGSGGAV